MLVHGFTGQVQTAGNLVASSLPITGVWMNLIVLSLPIHGECF